MLVVLGITVLPLRLKGGKEPPTVIVVVVVFVVVVVVVVVTTSLQEVLLKAESTGVNNRLIWDAIGTKHSFPIHVNTEN